MSEQRPLYQTTKTAALPRLSEAKLQQTKNMKTEITLPYSTPSLNETKGEHWSTKTARRKRHERHIWAMFPSQYPPRHPAKVRLEVVRVCHRLYDHDNFVGGAKCLIDALKNRGIIANDSDKFICEREYKQVQIPKASEEYTVIRIIDLY